VLHVALGFAHGVPQQALCSLADHVPTDGVAIAIPRSSVFDKLPSCTSARPAPVTDERRIHQRLGANSSSVRPAGAQRPKGAAAIRIRGDRLLIDEPRTDRDDDGPCHRTLA
jgi:hypothetical protein